MWGFFTWRWILTLGFDHMYSSTIFLGMLALLGISLMACTYTTQIPLVKVARRLQNTFFLPLSLKYTFRFLAFLLWTFNICMQMELFAIWWNHSQAGMFWYFTQSISPRFGGCFNGSRIWGYNSNVFFLFLIELFKWSTRCICLNNRFWAFFQNLSLGNASVKNCGAFLYLKSWKATH